MSNSIQPLFRLMIQELQLSADHKVKALSYAGELHAIILRNLNWDEKFMKELITEVLPELDKPDALDTGIPEIVKQFGQRRPANDNGGES